MVFDKYSFLDDTYEMWRLPVSGIPAPEGRVNIKTSKQHILTRTFRVFLCSLILGFCLVQAVTGQAAGAEANPRFALVIGNANYRNSSVLKNPLNDAGDISRELKELGFEVDILLDGDLVQMEDAVYRLGMKLAASPRAIGFFYYAGHGVQSGGSNYLIPVDSDIIAEGYLRTKALNVQSVYDQLASSKNNLNIIVLDACRDNPFAWGRSSSRGLAPIATQPPSSIVVYATSPGTVALDGAEKNGVFTAQLLKYLAEPGLEIKDVFNKTGGSVKSATNGKQLPVVYNQFFDSEYLAGAPAAAATAAVRKDNGADPPEATGRMTRYTAPVGGYADQMDVAVTESYIPNLAELDPILLYYLDPLAHAIHEGLMIPDPQTNKSIAGLAESYAISKDGKTYTFRIRRNAFWSDGRPVTAKDFVYSWLRLLHPYSGGSNKYLLEMCIEGAKEYSSGKVQAEGVGIIARDDKTLEVRLVRPAEYFLDLLSNSNLSPVPSHGSEWTSIQNIVSCGPYLVKEFVADDYILLEQNPRYWDVANVRVHRIKLWLKSYDRSSYYMSGALDWTDRFDPKTNTSIDILDDLKTSTFIGTRYLRVDISVSPFNDRNVRKAISAAIDRKTLAVRMSNNVIPADSIVPPFEGYTPQKGAQFDPEVARRYMADSGFKQISSFPEVEFKTIDSWVIKMLELNLGIRFRQTSIETVNIRGWWGDYSDPSTMLSLFLSNCSQNPVGYANPLFDSLIHKAETAHGDDRLKLLMEAEKILITQDQAVIPLYHSIDEDLIDLEKWGGWYPSPLGIHPAKFFYRK